MNEYEVWTEEKQTVRHRVLYRVRAESPDEAEEIVMDGWGHVVSSKTTWDDGCRTTLLEVKEVQP